MFSHEPGLSKEFFTSERVGDGLKFGSVTIWRGNKPTPHMYVPVPAAEDALAILKVECYMESIADHQLVIALSGRVFALNDSLLRT